MRQMPLSDGVRELARLFIALPTALAPLMGTPTRDYLQACVDAGREPDMGVLDPFVDAIQELQTPS